MAVVMEDKMTALRDEITHSDSVDSVRDSHRLRIIKRNNIIYALVFAFLSQFSFPLGGSEFSPSRRATGERVKARSVVVAGDAIAFGSAAGGPQRF